MRQYYTQAPLCMGRELSRIRPPSPPLTFRQTGLHLKEQKRFVNDESISFVKVPSFVCAALSQNKVRCAHLFGERNRKVRSHRGPVLLARPLPLPLRGCRYQPQPPVAAIAAGRVRCFRRTRRYLHAA